MKRLLSAFLLSAICTISNAQHLSLGAVRLSLGMEKEAVLKQLKEFFNVKEQKMYGDYLYTISTGKDRNFKYIGGISFKDDKLAWIQRSWGNYNISNNSHDYASALFAAIEGATASSGSSSTITTKITRTPELEIKQIDFVFSDRKITTLTSESRDNKSDKQASISESVSANR